MKIRDLNLDHVGQRVTIQSSEGVTITGPLTALSVDSDWIDDSAVCDPGPRWTEGRVKVTVSIGRWEYTDIHQNTEVSIEKSLR